MILEAGELSKILEAPERILEAPERSKSAIARFIGGVTGCTAAAVQNVNRSLTAVGMISGGGAGIMDAIAILIGALGNSAAKAPAAAHLFLHKMKLVNNHDAPDPQPHLKGEDSTPLGLFLASILLDGPQEIRRGNWSMSILSNPASAEISCGTGPARRIFMFMAPDQMEAKPMVRTAKVVPAEVLAGLSELILHGEGKPEGLDA
ncbi:MAG: hypothetical protein ACLPPF_11175 [Rhodomicrobium sp.]